MQRTLLGGLAVLALLVVGTAGFGADEVKPVASYKGSVEDLDAKSKGPKGPYVENEKTLKAMWKAWGVKGKLDEIDLKKHLVLVSTTRGSRLGLTPRLEDGKLTALGFATRDLRPGFRYVIVVVNREGIKSVNGKPLK